MTPIQPLDRTSPTFRADVDTLFEVRLPLLTTEINDVIEQLTGAEASEAAAAASAAAAAASAEAAAFAADAAEWTAGATYPKGFAVWSPITFQAYRRRVAGAGSTDPSSDPANWQGISRQSTFTTAAVSALDINLALGHYFTKTIAANSTFTFSNVPSGGSSFTLEVRHDGGSIAFPASVTSANGAMPTLTTGKTHMFMFSTRDGGTRWRLTAAANFTN